ncbi:MAG TPA: GH116 family glycosyl hydrolase [Terriglobales bacterium]|nr:GH116 family glycosyl hydrolase [Terriglobales bacterium]
MMHAARRALRCLACAAVILIVAGEKAIAAAPPAGIAKFELAPGPMQMNERASPQRFINAVGEKSGVWGFEDGRLEGWIYPLKIFHDFELSFQLEGSPRIYSGRELLSSVRIFPQMVQLQYSAEMFTVNEILFAPRNTPGFTILLDVKTPRAMRIYAHFKPDLNLMWPGGLGGQTYTWDENNKWLELAEPTSRFSALIGSPFAVGSTAVGYHAYLSNRHPFEEIEFDVTREEANQDYIPIIVSAGIQGTYDAVAAYHELLNNLPQLYARSLQHFDDLNRDGPQFVTPDAAVNDALRWSRVALDQLKICNPYLGCSYVSGYGSSGTGTRPMYAWYFDEPTITSWAFLDAGNTAGLKEAFRFLETYQRKDGAMPHEISQSATLINWFTDYPYPYIHPDSSLWYLIAMGHFYHFTGDRDFVQHSWPHILKAYQYCLSIMDPADGLLKIPKDAWGSMELTGFSKDAAMSGEWIAALHAMRDLAQLANDPDLVKESRQREATASASLERELWNPQLDYYDYGFFTSGKPVTYLNPAIGWSAWLGSLPQNHAQTVLQTLSTASFLADWGQRNMSLADPRYEEGSYHTGSAWPFATAGPMLAQFRYDQDIQAFLTWRAMLALRDFNAPGDMPEVLTGIYYRLLNEAVPHQMFSEMTAIPGLVDGILGLNLDVPDHALTWNPNLPPSWPSVALQRFPYGQGKMDLELHQSSGTLTARIQTFGTQSLHLLFSPALPMGSTVISVKLGGKALPYRVEDRGSDVHVVVDTRFSNAAEIEIRYKPGVALEAERLPLLEGDTSVNLRILHTSYANGRVEMTVEGRPGQEYEIRAYTPLKLEALAGVSSIEDRADYKMLKLASPANSTRLDRAGYVRWQVLVKVEP